MNCLFDKAVVFIRKSGFRGCVADLAALVKGTKTFTTFTRGLMAARYTMQSFR
jgi:hypothetical protein